MDEVLTKRRGMLEDGQRQSRQDLEHTEKLEQRSRELTALNRLFQKHLKERSAVVEAYRGVLDGLQTLAQSSGALAELARSKPLAELQQSLEGALDEDPTRSAGTAKGAKSAFRRRVWPWLPRP